MSQAEDFEVRMLQVGQTLLVFVWGPGPVVDEYLQFYLNRFPPNRFGTTYRHTRVLGNIQWLVLHRWIRK